MKTGLKGLLAGAALLGGVAGYFWQRQRATELRRTMADLRRAQSAIDAENIRLKEIVVQRRAASADAARSGREATEKVRAELAEKETFWRQLTAPPKPVTYEHFTANRDPEKGPVRIEHFRNVGQATPAAAFQTLVWALAGEHYEATVPLFGLSPVAREKLEAMLARMGSDAQAQYRPPEKVMALLFVLDFLKDTDGFEIGAAGEPDASGQVKLPIRRARSQSPTLSETKIPLQRGPVGWQLPMMDAMIDLIPAMLEQRSMYVPPKRTGN